jgi:hypothetical protein
VSDPVTIKPYEPSSTTMTETVELPVPRYSQEIHKGEYPQFDNDGFFFKSTNGHLMVIVGFTADGNPIVNDPASPDDPSVRHVYGRAQFEDAWMTATGGIVYVIHPGNVPLPSSPGGNW